MQFVVQSWIGIANGHSWKFQTWSTLYIHWCADGMAESKYDLINKIILYLKRCYNFLIHDIHNCVINWKKMLFYIFSKGNFNISYIKITHDLQCGCIENNTEKKKQETLFTLYKKNSCFRYYVLHQKQQKTTHYNSIYNIIMFNL